ncbi:MAG: putative lipid II flippase FtsW [Patescibacteria group bacterium]|nr:putative lipid II flippase FtsW [Patescibacteria group bacterium]MCL5261772.1 putative lipid II flippase FtsW [Patescibacteria group bacterium]
MLRKNADTIIIGIAILLIVLGFALLASASSPWGKRQFHDPYYFLERQLLFGLTAGVVGFLAGMFVSPKIIKKTALVALILNICLLVLVFTPLGVHDKTSSRWLEIKGLSFQPSELLKITFIIYIASWLAASKRDRKTDVWEGFLPFLIISGLIGFLLVIQPATSIVLIIMAATLIVYFVSGAKLSFIAAIVMLAVVAFGLLIALTPYRLARFITFFNKDADPLGASFQVNQAMIAIGSGQLFGVGYGNSTSKIIGLPEPIGDSIFAIAAEELGFVGVAFFILLFLVLTLAGFFGSLETKTKFGKFAMIGFSSIIGIQAFVNMGAISGLIPLTGTPLPFISYGGTSLAVFMTMLGLMVNFYRHA